MGGEGKKHNCLTGKAAVTDNCNGKYLTQPPDLNSTTHKKKKKKDRTKTQACIFQKPLKAEPQRFEEPRGA